MDAVSVGPLTAAEQIELGRRIRSRAFCLAPPAAPDVEFTCDRCGTVWQTRELEDRWEWLPIAAPGACPHGTIERYEDGTIGCLDACGSLLAVRGVWGAI